MSARKIEAVVQINNTPEAVIDYISDVRNRSLFLPSLKSVENVQEDPSGVGTSWTWKWVALGMEFEGTARCTECQAGKCYSFESQGGINSNWTYTAESNDGGTELRVEVEYEVPERAVSILPTEDVLERLRHSEIEHASQNLKTILDL